MNFKISCLLFFRDPSDRILLIKRNRAPNLGCWSPPGGKLEMSQGESPFECAKREALEEVELTLSDSDLNLFGYVSEKCYEGDSHWLMFLFDCHLVVNYLPKRIDEGRFKFFSRAEIEELPIPLSDHELVWPYYDKRMEGFWGLRADCSSNDVNLVVEAKPPQT